MSCLNVECGPSTLSSGGDLLSLLPSLWPTWHTDPHLHPPFPWTVVPTWTSVPTALHGSALFASPSESREHGLYIPPTPHRPVLSTGLAHSRNSVSTCGQDEEMSSELNLEGGFSSNFQGANESVSSLPPKEAQGLEENFPFHLASRLQVDSNGHEQPAIHPSFKSSFGAHRTLARDNRWPGAEVKGQYWCSGQAETMSSLP